MRVRCISKPLLKFVQDMQPNSETGGQPLQAERLTDIIRNMEKPIRAFRNCRKNMLALEMFADWG